VLKPYYRSLDELVEARNYAAERALLELLKTAGRRCPLRRSGRAGRRRSSVAACAGAPAARRLARAFTLH